VALGAGTGEALNEVAVSGRAWSGFAERFARLREAIELIRALWTEDSVDRRGGYYTLPNARIYDRPPVPVPVYVAAGGPVVTKYAGRIGDGFICTSGKGMELDTGKLLSAVADGAAPGARHDGRTQGDPPSGRAAMRVFCWTGATARQAEEGDPADAVAGLAAAADLRVAVAESLTGGLVCSRLARTAGASSWFAGGVVAYGREVKHGLLAVPQGPVVSAHAARAMASTVVRLTGADIAVALTGAAGPDPQDGQAPGTVFLAIAGHGTHTDRELALDGDPDQVCQDAATAALRLLHTYLGTQNAQ
jgi:PncC family amidohydrolase